MTLQPAPSLIISVSAGNKGGNIKLQAKSFQLDIWTGEKAIKNLAQGQNRNVTVYLKRCLLHYCDALIIFFRIKLEIIIQEIKQLCTLHL